MTARNLGDSAAKRILTALACIGLCMCGAEESEDDKSLDGWLEDRPPGVPCDPGSDEPTDEVTSSGARTCLAGTGTFIPI